MDYFIVAITTIAGLYFHWWLYVRIRRWMERDLALSMAAGDPAMQDYMLERLAEARRIIAEETVKPAKPRAIAEALGGGEATPVETTLQHVAHVIQSGTVPAKRAREALKRRMATIADDAGPEPAPRGLDEPAGPEAKAEVDAKLKQVKSRLGKGLDRITKETKGGQAAVDLFGDVTQLLIGDLDQYANFVLLMAGRALQFLAAGCARVALADGANNADQGLGQHEVKQHQQNQRQQQAAGEAGGHS